MATKNEIFQEQLSRYLAADKQHKGEILTHVCAVAGMHRKAAIRKFRSLQLRDSVHQEGRGRHVYYTKDVDAALETIWSAANEPCGELLYSMIAEYLAILKRDKLWDHSDEATGKLLAMKEHTVRRRVSGFAWEHRKKKGLSAPSGTRDKTQRKKAWRQSKRNCQCRSLGCTPTPEANSSTGISNTGVMRRRSRLPAQSRGRRTTTCMWRNATGMWYASIWGMCGSIVRSWCR